MDPARIGRVGVVEWTTTSVGVGSWPGGTGGGRPGRHYSCPDVLPLLVDRAPNPVVVEREVPAPAFVGADGPA